MRMALSGRHARCLPVLEAVSSRLKLHDAPRALLVQDAVAALPAPNHVSLLDHVLVAAVAARVGDTRVGYILLRLLLTRQHCLV